MISKFYRSTIGKKFIMALTGLIFVGFVVGHMAGNLKIFGGINPKSGMYKFDEYAIYLRSIAHDLIGYSNFLWIARAVLLASIILHISMAVQVSMLNKKAKPQAVANQKYGSSTIASRTMLIGGIILLAFIVFHILHFTTGTLHYNNFVEGHVYANVYNGFQNYYIVAFYLVAMIFLCLHLYHGTWSAFQTLGIDNPAWNKKLRCAAKLVAVVVFLGFISLPLAVTFKVLPAPVETVHVAH